MSDRLTARRRLTRVVLRGAFVAACALLLSGCVVYPARPYGYYYPGYYYGGGWGYGRGWR